MTHPQFSRTGTVWAFLAASLLATASYAAAQTESVIHRFQDGAAGVNPTSGLVADSNGSLYGVAGTGGISCSENVEGCGVVYKLSPPASGSGSWRQAVLYSFAGGADGGDPWGNLSIDPKTHKVYGTAPLGGANSQGVVFELTPGSPWTESIVYDFKQRDGSNPTGGILFNKGTLFGVTANGGTNRSGTVYALRPPSVPGSEWNRQVLHQFADDSNGFAPSSPLIADSTGAIYGTTINGNPTSGTVFKIAPPASGTGPWTFSVLYAFTLGANGGMPQGNLVFDSEGRLYGTTNAGGDPTCRCGTVLQLTPPAGGSGPWTISTLHTFTGGTDGANPQAGVTFDNTGALYGSTLGGGDVSCAEGYGGGCGTVFKVIASGDGTWSESVVYAFQGSNDGVWPASSLLFFNNNFYGTTLYGGGKGDGGTAFQMVP